LKIEDVDDAEFEDKWPWSEDKKVEEPPPKEFKLPQADPKPEENKQE
jgi:hypothetical protein